MAGMERYFVYPKDVDAFGFDWGRLALTVGPDFEVVRTLTAPAGTPASARISASA